VLAAYAARARGETYAPPVPPSYRDYLAWLARQDHAAAARWWTRSLAGIGEPARLPAPRDPVPGHAHRRRDLDVAAAVSLAAAHGVTFATVLQGALALVLRRYYGRDDVTVGLTGSGRPAELPGVERMLGVFINTLPLRMRVDEGATVAHWLAELQRRALALRQHEHLSLAQVQTLSGLPGGTALFDTLLVLENYPAASAAPDGGLRVTEHANDDRTHYPLTLALAADGTTLHVHASFDTQAVDAALADDLLDDLAFVLERLPTITRVGALPPLPSQHRWTLPAPSIAAPTIARATGTATAPRTALEWQLRDAWREVLARDDVGVDDDFFALGGHSLLAMRLLGRLRRLQGQDLPLATVFAHPTVARMADFLGTRSARANVLVRLRAGDNGAPLFCLHAGGGHTLAYAPALERLPSGVGAFGVNSRMLVDNDWRPSNRDALLDDYLALIRVEQPHGPYRLLGWSLGGTLAYALAERLERAGERVAFVGLVDCFGWREAERVAHPALAGLTWLPEYLAFLEPPQREALYRQPQVLAELDAALVAAADEPARQTVLATRYAALAGEGVYDAERHLLQLRLFRAWDDVLDGYAPGPLAAPVWHWQAADSVALFGGVDDAWQAHAQVKRRTFAGDHYTIIESPALADAIAAAVSGAAVENATCR
jgi:thioesterase domain-containing protein/aryl carrier-like protein